MCEYTVHLAIEPAPGSTGDPRVLQVINRNGFPVRRLDGSTRMLIEVRNVPARSGEEATIKALERVRRLIPDKGYVLSAADGSLKPSQVNRVVTQS